MGVDLMFVRALFLVGVALLIVGAGCAWLSANAVKRVIGVVLALFGALLTLGALGAGDAGVAGLAAGFAYLALGAALVVRLQEDYGGVEIPAHDSADEASEPLERGA